MKERSIWVDNLKSLIILLVVAHHAALAYTTYAKFNPDAYIFSIPHPMVDHQRWIGMDLFVYFNDIFFMSLMFFVSGLFVISSLKKKGRRNFVNDRFRRLFIPFLVSVTILMLIAHYPSYLLAHKDYNIKNYLLDFFTTEYWPVGPPWFLWVLFLFNVMLAYCYNFIRGFIDRLSIALLFIKNKPLIVFIIWFLFTWVLYVPMRWIFGPSAWMGIGPFDFQECRVFLYLGYFLAGAIFGNLQLEKGLFSDTFTFMLKWPAWLISCFLVYLFLLLIDNPLKNLVSDGRISEPGYQVIYCSIYVASCSLSCMAFLTTFKALFNRTNKIWESLKSNSFLIYLLHYVFIIWTQYLLLQLDLPAIAKFLMVSSAGVALSWLLSHLIRQNYFLRLYV